MRSAKLAARRPRNAERRVRWPNASIAKSMLRALPQSRSTQIRTRSGFSAARGLWMKRTTLMSLPGRAASSGSSASTLSEWERAACEPPFLSDCLIGGLDRAISRREQAPNDEHDDRAHHRADESGALVCL